MGHSYRTILSNILVEYFSRIILLTILLIDHSCRTFLWDILIGYVYEISL